MTKRLLGLALGPLLLAGCGTGKKPLPGGKPELAKPAATPAAAAIRPAEAEAWRHAVVALPAGWTKRRDGGALAIEGPDGIKLFVVMRPEPDPTAAVAAAWKRVPGGFAGKPTEVVKLPTPMEPFERSAVAKYRVEADQVLRQAMIHRHKDRIFAVLLAAPLAAVKKRAAQLREVVGSLRPKGAAKKKLTAKDARDLGPADVDALKALIGKAREKLDVPGVAFALVQRGKPLLVSAWGQADTARKRPMTTRTRMMIGSITKSFTAMALARLVADKRFAWDTPVTKVFADFKLKSAEQAARVQMQHLLCACTGVPRRDLPLIFEWEKATPKSVLRDLGDFELLTDFGETFQYSNQLVAAAGFIAGKAAGGRGALLNRYRRLLRKRVLDPLGMKDTLLDFRAATRGRRHAMPHSENIRGEVTQMPVAYERFVLPYAPAGALWTTAEDFSKLLVALTAEAGAPGARGLLPREQLAELWRPRVKVSAEATYGLGWMSPRYKGIVYHGHGGGTLGFISYFAYVPAAQAAFVILTNGSRGGALRAVLVDKLMASLFGQTDESSTQLAFIARRIAEKLAKLAKDLGEPLPADEAKPLVGLYRHPELGQVRIAARKGQLTLDTGRYEMAFLPQKKAPRPESYVLVDPPLTGFSFWVEHKDGKPTLNLEPNSVRYTLTKVR